MTALTRLRPARLNDAKAIIELATRSGVGLTTLPRDPEVIKAKLASSVDTFNATDDSLTAGLYFFVLEDLTSQKIVGTAAIDPAVGHKAPFYSYKVATIHRVSKQLNMEREYAHLNLVNDYQGKTELCTLFLAAKYRGHGNGVLLSLGRLLFMAQQPERFSDLIFAELRGVSNAKGESPFWNSLGKHFFDMDFAQADHLSAVTDKQFIADLMPRKSIYTSLLTRQARQAIGKVHAHTKPAYRLLTQQGFDYQNTVDIFDAGPTLECKFENVQVIRKSSGRRVSDIGKVSTQTTSRLIANTQRH